MMKLEKFTFEGVEISLDSKVGIFITMNPGYAGRTELPESVKALFRPVVCIVPDLEMICMISLFSDGFLESKTLAKKMTVLYKLAREQLSKQVLGVKIIFLSNYKKYDIFSLLRIPKISNRLIFNRVIFVLTVGENYFLRSCQ